MMVIISNKTLKNARNVGLVPECLFVLRNRYGRSKSVINYLLSPYWIKLCIIGNTSPHGNAMDEESFIECPDFNLKSGYW